jgi:creatinine amidohydrolase
MPDQEVILSKLTRREFREAIESGKYQTAVIPTGSNEQHLEHLAMEHDIASSSHVAIEAASRIYPQVIVTVPMAIGISEHHMAHKGTMSAKPGSWLAVLFDSVESLVRHGVKNVLILNGHGGNVAPVKGIIGQWVLYFKLTFPEVNLQFCSYWDLIPQEFGIKHVRTKNGVPGHAQEFETAFAMAVFPENVRHEAMQEQEDSGALLATAEQGQILVEESIEQTKNYLQGMIDGQIPAQQVHHH